MDNINVGIIGLGQRGYTLLDMNVVDVEGITITALCDIYQDRIDAASECVQKKCGYKPELCTTDYREVINSSEVDAVMIFAAWEVHIPIAIETMRIGKPIAVEVAGAYTIEQCFELVKVYEETKTPIMMLENCCYGRNEMMIMNMIEKGVFGKIVHCDGGYCHDLRSEISGGIANRHYRFRNYKNRCCDNYPTHQLGPICQILGINRGNRMVSLVSVASKGIGLHDYILKKNSDDEKLMNTEFCQGDVVTTIIKCAHGETITLALDTSLPRYYSRKFAVHGTDAFYQADTNAIFIDDGSMNHEKEASTFINNFENYRDEFEHPVWKKYIEDGVHEGHGGMDWLVVNDFFDCLKENRPMPIDVYDMAAWMSVTVLSEKSIALGSVSVDIPDFTNGKWCRE